MQKENLNKINGMEIRELHFFSATGTKLQRNYLRLHFQREFFFEL